MVRVLWIEDDYDIISDLPFRLEEAGYEFTILESKKDFVDNIRTLDDYEMVIVDLIIPQRDDEELSDFPGVDVIRILREHNKHIPVVVLSVVQDPKIRDSLEVDLILHKGALTPVDFKDQIEACLKSSRARANG